jgi:hypothetical protein
MGHDAGSRPQGSSHDAAPSGTHAQQGQHHPYASEADMDAAGLERAFDAFRAHDVPYFVEQLLACETGAPSRSASTPDGTGWIAMVRGAPVFVTLREAAGEIVLEAPIARLPGRQRLPALRLALELCARDAAASRVCIRGELLLLRFTARLPLLTPPVLRYYLRETGQLAARYAGLMTVSLDAQPAIAEDARRFEAIGRPSKIHLAPASGGRRSTPPITMGTAAPPPGGMGAPPASRVEGAHEGSSMGASAKGFTMGIVARPVTAIARAQASLDGASEAVETGDAIPAILAPPRTSAASPEPRSASAQAQAETSRRGAANSLEASSASRAWREVEIEAGSRRGAVPSPPSSEPPLSPSDRLCMLLRHAQSLASLTLEERPATLNWLVRSAVFRAIYEFKDPLPDAVAHLYRCTGPGRDASGAARVSSGQLQAVEPALVVMERVIVARAQVQKEKPLAIEPMTSASQAKEHVARYLLEIDRAPADPPLRHFLALGALTELLVRTKLPTQTDQRLRDIVAHAQREGARNPAIELMMTALQRINS